MQNVRTNSGSWDKQIRTYFKILVNTLKILETFWSSIAWTTMDECATFVAQKIHYKTAWFAHLMAFLCSPWPQLRSTSSTAEADSPGRLNKWKFTWPPSLPTKCVYLCFSSFCQTAWLYRRTQNAHILALIDTHLPVHTHQFHRQQLEQKSSLVLLLTLLLLLHKKYSRSFAGSSIKLLGSRVSSEAG